MVEEQGLERPRGASEHLTLDALQALDSLQLELSSEHEKNLQGYTFGS